MVHRDAWALPRPSVDVPFECTNFATPVLTFRPKIATLLAIVSNIAHPWGYLQAHGD
jgi:hypothetical protein